ncbi:hypothetical protein [Variovorax sp. J22R115]|uniref:hypothetical protein n=1 Tax=Variovorax sp. J22R115 TaxID=3053509 RepID=UPI002578A763|nr:hypothetical protein [Variovorax sp. J22R115]MDM0049766.1 hypothetical protein [Variovorax sp. J22R115]
MENPIIRFRIDPHIAKEVHRMAAEIGMELPDVMRAMLTKAVRNRSFSIDRERDAPTRLASDPVAGAYEPRYWDPLKPALEAELALALLHRIIARLTTSLDEGLSLEQPDLAELERVRDERDAACQRLADFDPNDRGAVQGILARFGASLPISDPDGPVE